MSHSFNLSAISSVELGRVAPSLLDDLKAHDNTSKAFLGVPDRSMALIIVVSSLISNNEKKKKLINGHPPIVSGPVY